MADSDPRLQPFCWDFGRLFLAAQQIYLQGDPAAIDRLDRLLRSNPWQLFRRLRWQLYADFPSLTLNRARADALQRIPYLNEIDYSRGSHDYEFAQLLVVTTKIIKMRHEPRCPTSCRPW